MPTRITPNEVVIRKLISHGSRVLTGAEVKQAKDLFGQATKDPNVLRTYSKAITEGFEVGQVLQADRARRKQKSKIGDELQYMSRYFDSVFVRIARLQEKLADCDLTGWPQLLVHGNLQNRDFDFLRGKAIDEFRIICCAGIYLFDKLKSCVDVDAINPEAFVADGDYRNSILAPLYSSAASQVRFRFSSFRKRDYNHESIVNEAKPGLDALAVKLFSSSMKTH